MIHLLSRTGRRIELAWSDEARAAALAARQATERAKDDEDSHSLAATFHKNAASKFAEDGGLLSPKSREAAIFHQQQADHHTVAAALYKHAADYKWPVAKTVFKQAADEHASMARMAGLPYLQT